MRKKRLAGRSASALLAAVLLLSGCVSASSGSSAAGEVAVYQAPPGPAGRVDMPAGCRLVRENRPQTLSEADLAQPDIFLGDRARALSEGANVLLLVERLVAPRQDFDCAATQPISDCPQTLGAWYSVVSRSYACDAAAREALASQARDMR